MAPRFSLSLSIQFVIGAFTRALCVRFPSSVLYLHHSFCQSSPFPLSSFTLSSDRGLCSFHVSFSTRVNFCVFLSCRWNVTSRHVTSPFFLSACRQSLILFVIIEVRGNTFAICEETSVQFHHEMAKLSFSWRCRIILRCFPMLWYCTYRASYSQIRPVVLLEIVDTR